MKEVMYFIFCMEYDFDFPHTKLFQKIEKYRNGFLIGFPFIIIISFSWLPNIIFFYDFYLNHKVLQNLSVFLPILYIVGRLYWNWIKCLWKSLKVKELFRYVAIIIIPIIIITVSYQFWFHFPYSGTIPAATSITVDTLNGFYSSLFTAIAVLIGIAGLFAWKKISELSEKLTQLKEIEDKVKFLDKKRDYAKWAKEKFDGNELNITSPKLNLSGEDKKKFDEIRSHLLEEITDNSWLEIILAKKFLDNKEFKKVFKIYDFIEKRDLLDDKSKIEPVLYHLLGQLYSDYYFSIKNKQKSKITSDTKIDKINAEINAGKKITIKEHLNACIEYYERSLKMREEQKITNDETLGNLAVVLIEAYKLESNSNEQADIIKKAISYLEEIINQNKATYNTYYDFARATYLNDTEKNNDVVNCLEKSAEKVNSIKGKEKFYDFLDNEDILNDIQEFEEVKSKLKSIIDGKKWLK